MKMSLLDMVQDILSDMSSDAVNALSDTEESLQVVNIIKSTYFEMMTRREWPHLKQIDSLDSFGDSAYPTHLLLPENTRRLEWVTYNKISPESPVDHFDTVKYLYSVDFIQWTNSRNTSNSNVATVKTTTDVPFKIITDSAPTYWTSFDDKTIVMDSYNSGIEDTLQGQNSQCELYIYPAWETKDSFVPNMPAHLFPALLAEAKSTCFYVLKQTANEKAEQQSKRQQNKMSMGSWVTHGGIHYPNYGRK